MNEKHEERGRRKKTMFTVQFIYGVLLLRFLTISIAFCCCCYYCWEFWINICVCTATMYWTDNFCDFAILYLKTIHRDNHNEQKKIRRKSKKMNAYITILPFSLKKKMLFYCCFTFLEKWIDWTIIKKTSNRLIMLKEVFKQIHCKTSF